jgi:hypothetical protein
VRRFGNMDVADLFITMTCTKHPNRTIHDEHSPDYFCCWLDQLIRPACASKATKAAHSIDQLLGIQPCSVRVRFCDLPTPSTDVVRRIQTSARGAERRRARLSAHVLLVSQLTLRAGGGHSAVPLLAPLRSHLAARGGASSHLPFQGAAASERPPVPRRGARPRTSRLSWDLEIKLGLGHAPHRSADALTTGECNLSR